MRAPGRLLLRAFLGLTFVYAGLDKLTGSDFLDPASPVSLHAQLARAPGPLGGVAEALAGHSSTVGVGIAVLELIVGGATLAGVAPRLAAATGAVLTTGFWLTVGWGVDPWYLGNDLPYLVGWASLALSIPAAAPRPVADPEGRRVFLRRSLVGAGVVAAAGGAAGVARLLAGAPSPRSPLVMATAPTTSTTAAASAPAATAPATNTTSAPTATPATDAPATTTPTTAGQPTSTTPSPSTTTPAPEPESEPAPPSGPDRTVASSTQVTIGNAVGFVDPLSGQSGFLTRTAGGACVALSDRCTHASCQVGFDAAAAELACPCHGSRYELATGQVLQGPAVAPLPRFPVEEKGGVVRLL